MIFAVCFGSFFISRPLCESDHCVYDESNQYQLQSSRGSVTDKNGVLAYENATFVAKQFEFAFVSSKYTTPLSGSPVQMFSGKFETFLHVLFSKQRLLNSNTSLNVDSLERSCNRRFAYRYLPSHVEFLSDGRKRLTSASLGN